jgi:O-methyltransferase
MKKLIKKYDQLIFFGLIHALYIYFRSKLIDPKITPLSNNAKRNFGQLQRLHFFQSAQIYLQVNRIDGIYLEFGSHGLNTFRMALNILGSYNKPNKIFKFIAFDSFEGMPEPEGIDAQKIWKKSMNFTTLESFHATMKFDRHRVEAVKGFYNLTLPFYNFDRNQKIALAYIDCDYYSSTKDVLNFLKDKISHGTLLAFDDWDCYYADPKRGQRLAFDEFKNETSNLFSYENFRIIDSGGMSFICHEKNKVGQAIL